MRPVVHAIVDHKVTSISLRLVPFLVWLEKLEPSAKDAKDESIKRIPAIKLLNFMRSMTRSDITIRASCEMPSEAGGFTPLATDVAQRVSPTVKELEPLPSADAVNTVGGLLSGGEGVEMNEQAAGNPCICF
ncbi:uncharacterized protein F5147DRAFT_702392 [Suillus discolor]|uniref:Uncharacterized protein n=1 Tax=Suillus discolor TaxID=1912936 RepID=A0A9P7F300_9AGAM|nr:uncharacterized protein F5147DRAFT_702392 [Suillus discolor]KAG2105447.1 hypothetical protein F5147DRAFT_702392 [Suillus discolor]